MASGNTKMKKENYLSPFPEDKLSPRKSKHDSTTEVESDEESIKSTVTGKLINQNNEFSTASVVDPKEFCDQENETLVSYEYLLDDQGNLNNDIASENENYEYSSTLCRICLNEGDIPIFGTYDLSYELRQLGKIEVTEDDGLPQCICQPCKQLLELAIKFLKRAQKTNKLINGKVACTDYDEIKREYIEFKDTSDSENDKEKQEQNSDDDNIEMKIETDSESIILTLSDKGKAKKCNVTFDTVEELLSHSKFHPKSLKECLVCHKLIDKMEYKIHIEHHRQKYKQKKAKLHGKIECEICHKTVGKSYYKNHKKMHGTSEEQAERMIQCPVCNKAFNTFYINDHMKRMHDGIKTKGNDNSTINENQLNCPICDKKVKESIFKEHLEKHGGFKKKYICDTCGKVFKYPSAFKTHKLTHGTELKYKCQFCPYRGLHQGLLKVHVRTHTGDYNYKCTECPAKFITKSNLSKHLDRHAGIQKYKCGKCNKLFYTKRLLEKHDIMVHSDKKDVICNICGKAFAHRDNMLSHQLKIHKRAKLTEKRGRIPSYMKIKLPTEEIDEEIDM